MAPEKPTQAMPSIRVAKEMARQLRREQSAAGQKISHSQALEQIAHKFGHRNWNVFCASAASLPPSFHSGDTVRGRYLGQRFQATIRSAEALAPGWFALDLEFETGVDVVRFDSFSNMRKRVRCVVGPDGTTRERTSDGDPQMTLDR